MRRLVWVGVGCVAVIVGVGGWNVMAANVLHGEVTPRTLFLSVENESGGGNPFGDDRHEVCHPVPAPPRAWTCAVEDPGGSGGAVTYRAVMQRDGSCWDARAVDRFSSTLPSKISGCVHLHERD
jgi:hypothetical protein